MIVLYATLASMYVVIGVLFHRMYMQSEAMMKELKKQSISRRFASVVVGLCVTVWPLLILWAFWPSEKPDASA